ncbi:MFS transporter [Staphylococcus casei]|uniref:Quinolone resistance protein NorB n=1 Tax=Staphylococcus casei TaxID=201828 RepID=A0ABZ2WF87_9STAP|nr:MFS transporter [Staphylococcus succinus]
MKKVLKETDFKGNGRLLTGIVLGVITFWLFSSSLVNIVPTLKEEFGANAGIINAAVSITALFSGMFVVGAGSLADKFGYVKMTYIGLVLNILGSLLIIISSAVPLFITGRIIQGFSAAIVMPATLSLVKAYYNGRHRQAALSYWSIGSWGGGGIASFFGGIVSTAIGWKWIFIISIIVSLISILLIKGTPEVRAQSKANKKFDIAGLVIFVIFVFSINLIITQSSDYGLFSPLILTMIAIFIISLIIFIIVERRINNPLIDFKIFKDMGYTGSTLSNFLMNAVAGTLIVGNTFVQESLGFNAFQSGALTITYLVTVIATIRIGEKILQHLGAKKPMVIGSLLNMIGIILISFTFLPNTLYVVFCIVGYFIYGLGLGFYATPSMDTAIANASEDQIGMASGVYKMSSSLGNAFGVALSGTIYAIGKTALSLETSAMLGFGLNVLLALLSFIIVLFAIPRKQGIES